MKRISSPFAIIFIVSVLFFSCNQDDDGNKPSREKLLTGIDFKEWKITSITGSTPDPNFSFITVDVFNNSVSAAGQTYSSTEFGLPSYPECAKDDILVFKSDKTYETKEGNDVCVSDGEFQVSSGTWELQDKEEKLILKDASGQTYEYTITELTETKLKGKTSSSVTYMGSNISIDINTTFDAQ